MEKTKRDIALGITVNLCRFVLAFTFIFSGFVKAVDPLGSQYKITDYVEAFGLGSLVPDFIPLIFGIGLAVYEFTIGMCMFLGIKRDVAPALSLLLMLFMTPLTLYLAISNPVSDCGCFGDALVLTNWQTFYKNILLLAAAIVAFKWRGKIIDFISPKTEWIVSLYSLVYVALLAVYCLNRLPVFDFRPYKIGTNIPEAMAMPAQLSTFKTTFIMEKNGERREFDENNYPDDSWTFVDRRTEEIAPKGGDAKATIDNFSMRDIKTGEDITDEVLTAPGYTFLLVAHRIEQADDSNIDLINEIYDYSVENDYGFYCLTSSTLEDIEMWCDRTGAEYPFCLADDITLKTIIRSNPGLLLLKDGVILNKWDDNSLPDEYALTDRLENIPLGEISDVNRWKTTMKLFLWFFVPLMLVIWLDQKLKGREEEKKAEKENKKSEEGKQEIRGRK